MAGKAGKKARRNRKIGTKEVDLLLDLSLGVSGTALVLAAMYMWTFHRIVNTFVPS